MKKINLGEIFINNLKTESQLKEIGSIFEEGKHTEKINYAPPFQRKYIWGLDKASYLVESILLGTEIPPIILFDDDYENQVIDGRQRCETIERYLNNKFSLQDKGLRILKSFSGMYYKDLPEDIKFKFLDTKLRIIQFSIVNRKNIGEYEEEKIKKEIFRRYNSGIMPLKREEIERAEYISDELSNKLYEKFKIDLLFFNTFENIFGLKKDKKNIERDKINNYISKYRKLMIISKIPISEYAKKDKYEIEMKYFYYYKEILKDQKRLEKNYSYLEILNQIKEKLKKKNQNDLAENSLFFECLYWGISILDEHNILIKETVLNKFINGILNISIDSKIWNNISHDRRDINKIFEKKESHYYKKVMERYTFIANYLNHLYGIKFEKYFFDLEEYKKIMCYKKENSTEIIENIVKKSYPISMSIEDISRKINENRFIIRPEYQRSEICNLTSASYLLESIMLGIKIPPIYVFKRKNNTFEVIDGQQRILSLIAFLGRKYLEYEGEKRDSLKNKFKLKNLRVLIECNKKSIDNIGENYKRKILNFQLDVIEIEEESNKNFNRIDLFLRLNIKQYPIDPNSFEMWNGYGYKEAIVKIRELAMKYEKRVFARNNRRMKVETLITLLAYLEYKEKFGNSPYNLLGIFLKDNKVSVRIKSREAITKTLDDISENEDEKFLNAIENIEKFINKIQILVGDNSSNLLKLVVSNNLRKGKKDQNFYLLWLILRKVEVETLRLKRDEIFRSITRIFKKSQENIEKKDFIYMIENICEKCDKYTLPF